ncbi:hypothetical protein ABZ172_03100 [Streptomyces sp. NPDC006296]|uniref:hypothetical protein n=1 Tax=Streptomyces sp. NPDC006296 TaxID=3156746 RepID=UPI0033BC4E98
MTDKAHTALIEEVADAVLGVEGVAFLRPGVAQQVRSALSGARTGTRTRAPGVRMSRTGDARDGRWDIDLHIVVLGDARAVDVARGARKAVTACLTRKFPEEKAPSRVTVTVTGLL